jgi:flagellar hook-associated protein 3 FlgL
MMSNSILLHLQRQAEQLYNVQTKIATGKQLNKPSDDPIGLGQVLNYRSKLSVIEQYQDNINQGKTLIESNELTLELMDELIGLARGLAQEYSDPDLSPEDKQMAAKEVQDIYDQIVALANSKFGGNYVFSGHQTDTAPFSHLVEISGGVAGDLTLGLSDDATDVTIEIRDQNGTAVRTINLGDGITPGSGGTQGINTIVWDGLDDGGLPLVDGQYTFTITAMNGANTVQNYVTYNGDDGQLPIVIGENIEVAIDMDGRNYFTPAGGVNLFETLQDIVTGFNNPDSEAGSAQIMAAVEQLDQACQQINTKRSEYGPKLYRLEQAENHWMYFSSNLQIAIGKIEEADITQAALELSSLELAYESTIATAARIIQPGLVNFLD